MEIMLTGKITEEQVDEVRSKLKSALEESRLSEPAKALFVYQPGSSVCTDDGALKYRAILDLSHDVLSAIKCWGLSRGVTTFKPEDIETVFQVIKLLVIRNGDGVWPSPGEAS